ncbi:hypothetical protein PV08_06991 [Exophiala spinifera]|uniref:Uncharacterized protein n=1 Tax=Exophiala spinifera TaxID=91928 RepID=A0A0D2B687_9EURO|nr:uncharacterized protein PV08_06991 [Exophiala spinifera]KIW14210.1 hypothetical protein PV08_06991 [Exophiala spinifera]
MVPTATIPAMVLAGQNLVLDILAAYVVWQMPCWISPFYIFISHRTAQTILALAAVVLLFTLKNLDRAIAVPRIALLCEGAVEASVLYLYQSIRNGLHSSNQVIRYEPVVFAIWFAPKIAPFGLTSVVPWHWQPIVFAVPYILDQVLQIVMCVIFCQRIFVEKRGHLLKRTELCHWHYAWGVSRAVLHIVASGIIMTVSILWPYHQLLFFLVLTNVILFSPTPRAFLRYARARKLSSNDDHTETERDMSKPQIQHGITVPARAVTTQEHGSGEQLITASASKLSLRAMRSNESSALWSEVLEIEGYMFHVSRKNGRHHFTLDSSDDLWSLRAVRRLLPWASRYPRDKCTAEEFLLLAPGYLECHPFREGTPSLYDIMRDIHRKELQHTLDNFPAHQARCDECLVGSCPELFSLMFRLLLDMVNTRVILHYRVVEIAARAHGYEDRLLLTRVEPTTRSTVRLEFVRHNALVVIETPWEELSTISSKGICIDVSHDTECILPGWSEDGTLA